MHTGERRGPGEVIYWVLLPNFAREIMCCEGLLVSFCCLTYNAFARSKETPVSWHGVRGHPPLTWGEEFVRETVVFTGRVKLLQGVCSATGRSAESQQKNRVFDETLGYPGEDITRAFLVGIKQLLC